MALFRCEICGCIDNTALGHYWETLSKRHKGTEKEKAMCSECVSPEKGWHGIFPKRQATEEDKGTLENY